MNFAKRFGCGDNNRIILFCGLDIVWLTFGGYTGKGKGLFWRKIFQMDLCKTWQTY